jgi:hypothetical protein
MPSFQAPVYSKVPNPKTGNQDPCYTFRINFTDADKTISFVAESAADISLLTLQKCVIENVVWWNGFINQFLKASSKLFSKPYTVENINKIAKHILQGQAGDTFPANVTLIPTNIQIYSGNFTVVWVYHVEPIVIDIPDLQDDTIELSELPDSEANKVVNGLEELNIDELPVDKNATGNDLELDSPAKFFDKQRVKEARLKAKLAAYKAQRQISKYYEKYGADVSDSESESEYSSSDGESSDNDFEGEEVQL